MTEKAAQSVATTNPHSTNSTLNRRSFTDRARVRPAATSATPSLAMADAPGKNDITRKQLLPFDQFGKHMAVAILRRGGTVRTDVEVRTTARHIDVVFRPDRKRRAQLQAAGYLQTIANEPITIEFVHAGNSKLPNPGSPVYNPPTIQIP